MDGARERDEFARIKLHQDLEKARQIIALYENHQAEYRERIEGHQHELG